MKKIQHALLEFGYFSLFYTSTFYEQFKNDFYCPGAGTDMN